jgi:hypothetical protein
MVEGCHQYSVHSVVCLRPPSSSNLIRSRSFERKQPTWEFHPTKFQSIWRVSSTTSTMICTPDLHFSGWSIYLCRSFSSVNPNIGKFPAFQINHLFLFIREEPSYLSSARPLIGGYESLSSLFLISFRILCDLWLFNFDFMLKQIKDAEWFVPSISPLDCLILFH